MNSESDDPVKGLSEFFENIWCDTEGFVYLPTINRETGKWKKVFFKWPEHKAPIIQHVLAASAQGLDSYYSPSLYKTHDNPTKENVLGSHVLWTEFDGAAPENWNGSASQPTDTDGEAGREAHSASNGHMPPPSLRVQSSQDGHEHVYWKLEELQTDVQWIEDKNRAITYTYGADSSGWDSTQILRPPYTTNYKRDLPVTVRESNSSTFESGRFAFLRPPVQLVKQSIEIENLPSVDSIIAKYTWDTDTWELFKADTPQDRSGGLMKLGYFGAEKGMTDSEIYAILLHADDRWKKYVQRQDRKARLVDIINRARIKHPKGVEEYTFAGLLGSREEQITQGMPITYGFKSFLESEIEVEWAVEGLLEKGGMGMVAAMPGVGKTQLSIQLAACCALGTKFLIWDTLKPKKIVLFSLEMSHVALKIFMESIANQYTPEETAILEENLIIVPLGEVIHLDRPEGMKFIFSLLDTIKPDGIIIDSVGKTTMDELNEKVARLLNVQFRTILNRYNCFLWFIHHNRKATDNNKKPTGLADVYGNQYLTTDMTSVLILWTDFKTDDEVEVIPVKARLSKLPRPFKTHRNEHLHFSLRVTDDDKKIASNLSGDESTERSPERSDDGSRHFSNFGGI